MLCAYKSTNFEEANYLTLVNPCGHCGVERPTSRAKPHQHIPTQLEQGLGWQWRDLYDGALRLSYHIQNSGSINHNQAQWLILKGYLRGTLAS
jgi:hypothetical protein